MADDNPQSNDNAKRTTTPDQSDTESDPNTNTQPDSGADLSVRDANDSIADRDGSHVGDADVLAQERLLTLYSAGSISREEFMDQTNGTPPEEFDATLARDEDADVEPSENTVERSPSDARNGEADPDPDDEADDGSMQVRLGDEEDADPSEYNGDDDVVEQTKQEARQNKQQRDEAAPSSLEEVNRIREENGLDPVSTGETEARQDAENHPDVERHDNVVGVEDSEAEMDRPLAEDVRRQEADDQSTADSDTQNSRLSPQTTEKAEERGYTDDTPVEESDVVDQRADEAMSVPNDDDVDDEELREALEEAGVDPQASPMSDVGDEVPEDFNYEEQGFDDALGSSYEAGEAVHKELDGILFKFVMPEDDVIYDILENAIADPSMTLKERNNYVIQRVVQRPDFSPQQWASHTSPIQRGIIASEAIEFAGIDQLGNYLGA